MKEKLPKIIVLLGPTASGKTDLGIVLAKQFDGEVVSADSRQVYKYMDVGTGKPNGEWKHPSLILPSERGGQSNTPLPLSRGEFYMVDGVAHHVMDFVEPNEDFTLAHFKKMAEEKIEDILERGKLPIVVGGTGLYIWSIVDNLDMPAVAPDLELRAELEKKSLEEQVQILMDKDPETAKKIDLKNPRRVLRALEVCLDSGQSFVEQRKQNPPKYDVLQIGLDWPREEIYERIERRIDGQIKDAWVEEVKGIIERLDSPVLSRGNDEEKHPSLPSPQRGEDNDVWKLPSMSGIGYKQLGEYLRGERTLEEIIKDIKQKTRNYAKRQMTWFKRDKRIRWIEKVDVSEAIRLVKEFI